MLHPDTALRWIDEEIGYGVFATRFIPLGTVTWALDEFDQVYSPDAFSRLSPRHRAILEKYSYLDQAGNFVLCWDFARYMNHSCEPTTYAGGATFDVAVRD